MHLKTGTALLACAALVALTASVSPAVAVDQAAGGSPAAGRASGLTWKVVPSPNGASPDHTNLLFGVSCASPGFCVTVGDSAPNPLIESWDGTAWKIMSTPAVPFGSGFQDVSCVSARFCAAVGAEQGPTLIEIWNGSAWTVVPSPSVPNVINGLLGVSCVSARDCTAVGSFDHGANGSETLIESWNGTAWKTVPSPNRPPKNPNDQLSSVSCVSARACVAVGGDGAHALIESWNGTAWKIVPSAHEPPLVRNVLVGVSCLSASTCTAVGFAEGAFPAKTLVESWNGTAWKIVPSPNAGPPAALNGLSSVSCVTVRACTAVGDFSYPFRHRTADKTLVESWDGTRWTVVPSPNKAGGTKINALFSVSCPAPAMCMAAGNEGGSTRLTFTELGTSAG